MFILNKDSKLVKFSYMLRSSKPVYDSQDRCLGWSKIPQQTTLCQFFWRTFVFMPLFWIIITASILSAFFLAGRLIVENLVTTSVVAAAAVLGLLLVEWVKVLTKRGYVDSAIDSTVSAVKKSLFFQGLKALKGRMCPIIYFEEGKEGGVN